MQVLRVNKESLLAVLEAFVYDPLINWRLMPTEMDSRRLGGTPYLHSAFLLSHSFQEAPMLTEPRIWPESRPIPRDRLAN